VAQHSRGAKNEDKNSNTHQTLAQYPIFLLDVLMQGFQIQLTTRREMIRCLIYVDSRHPKPRHFASVLGDPAGKPVDLFTGVVQGLAAVVDTDVTHASHIWRSSELRYFTLVVSARKFFRPWPAVGVYDDEEVDIRMTGDPAKVNFCAVSDITVLWYSRPTILAGAPNPGSCTAKCIGAPLPWLWVVPSSVVFRVSL